MKRVEYSQIVRRKLKNLKANLTAEFGAEILRCNKSCGIERKAK